MISQAAQAYRTSSHTRSILGMTVARLFLIYPMGYKAITSRTQTATDSMLAPIDIVSDPKADDPTVRNGISCIGCHTEGMKTFEDTVRAAIEQNPNPLFDKERALNLYIEQVVMDTFVQEDTDRYRTALEKTGAGFGGVEPVHRFHETFFSPLTSHYAAAAVGLETQTFLEYVQGKPTLQNLGLSSLTNP